MEESNDLVAKELMDALMQIRRLHLKGKPDSVLKPSEVITLYQIGEINIDGVKVSELSDRMNVKSPTITQCINGLEANGFVERSIDLTDRRAVNIRLTEKGKGFIAQHQKGFILRIKGLVTFLGEDNSKELARLISQMFIYFDSLKSKAD
jgi:DNA-binding MarR family transcriptional regulator